RRPVLYGHPQTHESRRAIELNPKFDEIHYLYSFYLVVTGRFAEAIAEGRRALELDPFSLRINQHLGNSFYCAESNVYAILINTDPCYDSLHSDRFACDPFHVDTSGVCLVSWRIVPRRRRQRRACQSDRSRRL